MLWVSSVNSFLLTIDKFDDSQKLDKEKRSPVLLAASRAGWRTVFVLLRKGCDPTLKDINNRNLLHWIIINGGRCEDFAKEIKDNSKWCLASVLNEKDSTGCSPLVSENSTFVCNSGLIKFSIQLPALCIA